MMAREWRMEQLSVVEFTKTFKLKTAKLKGVTFLVNMSERQHTTREEGDG